MFTRPPLVPVLAGIWLLPVILGLILDPFGGVTFFLPQPAEAALRLREAKSFNRGSYCASGQQSAWRMVLEGPHAASWYRAIAADAFHPAGRLYGLIGLHAVDSGAFRQLIPQLSEKLSRDSVFVVADDSAGWFPVLNMLLPEVMDSTIATFRDDAPRPEC